MRYNEIVSFLEQFCLHKLFELDCNSVPTDLDRIANSMGARIALENMHHEGSVERDGDGFLIRIRRDAPLARRRFSLAHEIGHLFLRRVFDDAESPDYKRFRKYASIARGMDEESLANRIAGYLLLPQWFMRRQIGDRLSIRAVEQVAIAAQASLPAALIRSAQMATSPIVVFMARTSTSGSLHVSWHEQSESLSRADVGSDLEDEFILTDLITTGRTAQSGTQVVWNECQSVRRAYGGIDSWYGLASVQNRSASRTVIGSAVRGVSREATLS